MANPESSMATALRTLLRHSELINTLAAVVTDHARLLERGFERCARCDDQPATVVCREAGMEGKKFCDHCAATTLINLEVLGDDKWVDLRDAEVIRHVHEMVVISRRKDEPDQPTFH